MPFQASFDRSTYTGNSPVTHGKTSEPYRAPASPHQQHQRHRPRRSARLCAGDPAPLHGATETLGLLAAAYGIELPQHQPLEVSQIASNCIKLP